MLKGILEEEGIQVSMAKESGYRLAAGGLAVVPIQVLESDVQRARELIEAAVSGRFALEDEDWADEDHAEDDGA